MGGSVIPVNSDSDFASQLTGAGNKLVVVDFFATWCGPCRTLAPVFESLSERYPGAVWLKVDVETCRSTAATCGVRAMPTIQFYKNKSKVGEVVGADPSAIQRLVDQHYDAFQAFSGSGRKLTDAPGGAALASNGSGAASGTSSSRLAAVTAETGDCEVQVRLPNGEMLRGRFQRTDTLGKVKQYVQDALGSSTFNLMLPGFPKKVYGDGDLALTLEQEQLVPRAQLIVCS